MQNNNETGMDILRRTFRFFPACAFLVVLCLQSCRRDAALERALAFAGDNRRELEGVLLHYKDDSLNRPPPVS